MNNSRFYIQLEIEIHAVTSPGVWLCVNGGVELMIRTLGYSYVTSTKPSRFPMLFHESLFMNGFFEKSRTIYEVERTIRNHPVEISMMQQGQRLAYYTGSLGAILGPEAMVCLDHTNVFDSHLIMSPSKCYPGILGPQIEFTSRFRLRSTNFEIDRPVSCCSRASSRRPLYSENQKTNNRCRSKTSEEPRRRMKPVCHYPSNQPSPFMFSHYNLHDGVGGGGIPPARAESSQSLSSGSLISHTSRAASNPYPSSQHQHTKRNDFTNEAYHHHRGNFLPSTTSGGVAGKRLNEIEGFISAPSPLHHHHQKFCRDSTPPIHHHDNDDLKRWRQCEGGRKQHHQSLGNYSHNVYDEQYRRPTFPPPPTKCLNLLRELKDNDFVDNDCAAARGRISCQEESDDEIFVRHMKSCEICLSYRKYFNLI